MPGATFRGPAYEYVRADDNLPPLGAQDGCGDEAIAHVKLSVGGSRWTPLICEHDPAEALVFGWVLSALRPTEPQHRTRGGGRAPTPGPARGVPSVCCWSTTHSATSAIVR